MNVIAKHPRRKKIKKKKHFSGFYPNLLIKVIIWVHKKGHILSLSEKLKCAQKLYLLITWWVCRVCTILWTLKRRLVLIFDGWCSVSTTYFSVCTKWQKVFVEKVADTFFYPILLWGWEFSWVCVHGYGSWSFEKWFLSVKRYGSFIMHDILQ